MTDTPLATVAQLAAYLQEPIPDDDPSAVLFLQIASGMVRDYLQQQITQTVDDVVYVDPSDGFVILLPELPVTDVSLVETFDGTDWTTSPVTNYGVSKRLGIISALPFTGFQWPCEPESWRVTYTHGYETVPDSIIGATLGVAARAYASAAGADMERIGGYQVKYSMEADGFSAIEKAGLNRYLVARIA
jgi:hypothetical protein